MRDVELCFESRDGPRDASFITADARDGGAFRHSTVPGLSGSVNEKQGGTEVEVVSAEQARTLTYAVESWAGRLDEDMGSPLHRDSTRMWPRDPVQGPVRPLRSISISSNVARAGRTSAADTSVVIESARKISAWTTG